LVVKTEEKEHLENLGVEGWKYYKELKQLRWEYMDWIYVAQVRDNLRPL
jgi:hypothetical protein